MSQAADDKRIPDRYDVENPEGQFELVWAEITNRVTSPRHRRNQASTR